MSLGLLGAFAAALCYGVAAVLQAVGARRTAAGAGVDPRLLWRLARSTPYLLGLGLDGVGFLLSLAALRSLPLFVVQPVVAGYLAVTAVLAAWLLHARLGPGRWAAVAVVTGGLALLGLSAGTEHPAHLGTAGRLGLIAAAALVAGLTPLAARLPAERAVAALGLLAGLGFAVVGVAARVLRDPTSVGGLAGDPATCSLLAGGVLGLLLYATALQRGSVTTATAATVVGETLAPAAVGLLLGDRPRAGLGVVAAVGFTLAVAGALALAGYGEVPRSEETGEVTGEPAPTG